MTVSVGDMPWQNLTSMEEINRFVVLAQSGRFSVTDLCEQFGISRKTGYKHLERYAANGLGAGGGLALWFVVYPNLRTFAARS